jgi:hypothetical protein
MYIHVFFLQSQHGPPLKRARHGFDEDRPSSSNTNMNSSGTSTGWVGGQPPSASASSGPPPMPMRQGHGDTYMAGQQDGNVNGKGMYGSVNGFNLSGHGPAGDSPMHGHGRGGQGMGDRQDFRDSRYDRDRQDRQERDRDRGEGQRPPPPPSGSWRQQQQYPGGGAGGTDRDKGEGEVNINAAINEGFVINRPIPGEYKGSFSMFDCSVGSDCACLDQCFN